MPAYAYALAGRGDVDRLRGCLGDYLRQRGLPLRKNFRCLSPGHEDRNPSMGYNRAADNVHCFACGATYDIFDLIGMDYGLVGFGEQYAKAVEIFGGTGLPMGGQEGGVISLHGDGGLAVLRSKAESGFDYFLSRGITEESCKKHGLFQQGGRAYFPVNGNGSGGWCARAVDGAQPRYKNSPGPMGIWNVQALSGDGGAMFVTEGIIDAICLEQMGAAAVSLCGSQNTEKLLRLLERAMAVARRWAYVICADPDPAGGKMAATLSAGLARLGLINKVLDLPPESGDIGDAYLKDREGLERAVTAAKAEMPGMAIQVQPGEACVQPQAGHRVQSVELQQIVPEVCPASSWWIDDFFEAGRRRAAKGAASTGFPSLDKLLDGGLHPGLYVIGAVSSLGKTSFALQMADCISGSGNGVLFFSLEQSRYELMAKSLSRASAVIEGGQRRRAFTARQLLSGDLPGDLYGLDLLEGAKAEYTRMASKLYIREGMGDIGTLEIRRAVEGYKSANGDAPVVMVDYLQILRAADPRATDKQNTDRAVTELKLISRDFDIPVVAISSFNRENYRAAVSMEAFKESGAVEYSSDVLFGMQLAGAGERDFDVNRAKSREPRKVELVMLKNRGGIPWAKINLEYRAKFSLFSEG